MEHSGARPSGGVRAATRCATTLVSREALDHRLFAPTASGVVLCLRCLHTLNHRVHLDTYLRGAVPTPLAARRLPLAASRSPSSPWQLHHERRSLAALALELDR